MSRKALCGSVRLRALGALALVTLALFPGASTAAPEGAGPPGRYIVVLKDSAGDPGAVADEHARRDGVQVRHVYRDALDGYAAAIPADRLAALRSDPRVLYVEPDGALEPATQTIPTGIRRIGANLSSARSGDATGVVNVNVALIDIGIEASHPDLNVQKGKDCSASGTPYNPWHGTAVAGALAAYDNTAGVVGVAPGAKLFPARVTDFWAKAPFSDVVCAIDWVTATRRDKSRSNDIAVVNMSLIGSGSDDQDCGRTNGDAVHQAICNSVAAGVTYVVAAGNSSEDFQNWIPAAYDEVLTVTAAADSDGTAGGAGPQATCKDPYQFDDTAASFSNFATLPADEGHTVAAPGSCIYTTWIGGTYRFASGTSMATPYVAGTAALCIARGLCTGGPAATIRKLRADAATYNQANPGYGFQGDPLRPAAVGYYGWLIRSSLY